MTLVEVLAGTALLGTLLAALLVSSAGLRTLSRRAWEREESCRAAETLLEGWWPKKEKIPRGQSGEVPGHPGFLWRTAKVKELTVGSARLDVVSVEVYPARPAGGQQPSDANDLSGARIEILLPASANEKTSGTNPG